PALVGVLAWTARTAWRAGRRRGKEQRRTLLSELWFAALVLAVAMYADVRSAARQATDRWLVESRVLVQEADRAAHRASVVELARLVPGGTLVSADSGVAGPTRRRVAGATL